jgi:hypothetical protein
MQGRVLVRGAFQSRPGAISAAAQNPSLNGAGFPRHWVLRPIFSRSYLVYIGSRDDCGCSTFEKFMSPVIFVILFQLLAYGFAWHK